MCLSGLWHHTFLGQVMLCVLSPVVMVVFCGFQLSGLGFQDFSSLSNAYLLQKLFSQYLYVFSDALQREVKMTMTSSCSSVRGCRRRLQTYSLKFL